jgi:hypothetical protein
MFLPEAKSHKNMCSKKKNHEKKNTTNCEKEEKFKKTMVETI